MERTRCAPLKYSFHFVQVGVETMIIYTMTKAIHVGRIHIQLAPAKVQVVLSDDFEHEFKVTLVVFYSIREYEYIVEIYLDKYT